MQNLFNMSLWVVWISATKKAGSLWSMSEPSVGGGRREDCAVSLEEKVGFEAKEGERRNSNYWVGVVVSWGC